MLSSLILTPTRIATGGPRTSVCSVSLPYPELLTAWEGGQEEPEGLFGVAAGHVREDASQEFAAVAADLPNRGCLTASRARL
jgi:hypothetical protein